MDYEYVMTSNNTNLVTIVAGSVLGTDILRILVLGDCLAVVGLRVGVWYSLLLILIRITTILC